MDGGGRPLGADLVESVPFLVLGMDLPPAPLYKDALERNIIPQVPLQHIGTFPSFRKHHSPNGPGSSWQ